MKPFACSLDPYGSCAPSSLCTLASLVPHAPLLPYDQSDRLRVHTTPNLIRQLQQLNLHKTMISPITLLRNLVLPKNRLFLA